MTAAATGVWFPTGVKGVRALILTPTKELCHQTAEALKGLCYYCSNVISGKWSGSAVAPHGLKALVWRCGGRGAQWRMHADPLADWVTPLPWPPLFELVLQLPTFPADTCKSK